jgi:pimeloyl-ACP methyl ester carboxylesterase
MAAIRKGFAFAGHGWVHYRVAGSGPPVVLLHDSPRSSVLHLPQLEHFADEFTVIALDTPGYGCSDPLPREPRPEIQDFAAALERTLTALGIERCPIYGFHTSSKIVLEFAVRHPQRLTLAIMDGLNLPPGGPSESFIERYMQPFEVTADGCHLATAWTRARDLHRFFPWFDTTAKSRLPLALPTAEHLHEYVVDLLMAGAHYSSAYSAAMRYLALPRLATLRAPSVFMCRANDPLFSFLDIVEQQAPAQSRVIRISADADEWRTTLRRLLRESTVSAERRQSATAKRMSDASVVEVPGYLDTSGGQVRVNRYGRADLPPLLLLHDPPGSVDSLESLARALSPERQVIAIDYPGEGESDPIASPSVGAIASALLDSCRDLALPSFDIYAQHFAGSFGVEIARRAPERVRQVILDGPPIQGKAERRRLWKSYCPSLTPRADGAHLLAAWHFLRDRELSWPWFDGSAEAIRRRDLALTATDLHRVVTAIAKQPDNYADALRAALEYDIATAIPQVRHLVTVLHSPGDVRYASAAALEKRGTRVQLFAVSGDASSQAAAILGMPD